MAGIDVNSLLSVSRQLPAPSSDGTTPTSNVRGGRYREQYVLSVIRKNHLLVDEGVFYTTFSGNVIGAASTAPGASGQKVSVDTAAGFSDTACSLIIRNNDSVSNPLSKRVYVDSLTLICQTASAGASPSFRCAIKTDNIIRFTSGGVALNPTTLTPTSSASSIAQVQFGQITSTAASQAARVIGNYNFRTAVVPVGDMWMMNAGGVEANTTGQPYSTATAIAITQNIPPIVLAPGESALFHFFAVSTQTTAPVMELTLAHWER